MQNNVYKLRAHHGLCAYFFKGKGYSEEFTAHMAEVIKALQADATVCLVDSVDVICEKCPNNKAGVCETAELVEGYDKKTLEYCGLQPNDVLSFADFQKRVLERIIFAGEREKICGNCQWSSICRLETDEDK
jgi:hypothetical protein